MKLYDALLTKRAIKKRDEEDFCDSEFYVFTVEDVLSDVWEVEPEIVCSCPFCKSIAVQVRKLDSSYYVFCVTCCASGSSRIERIAAVRDWNGVKR